MAISKRELPASKALSLLSEKASEDVSDNTCLTIDAAGILHLHLHLAN